MQEPDIMSDPRIVEETSVVVVGCCVIGARVYVCVYTCHFTRGAGIKKAEENVVLCKRALISDTGNVQTGLLCICTHS